MRRSHLLGEQPSLPVGLLASDNHRNSRRGRLQWCRKMQGAGELLVGDALTCYASVSLLRC